MNKYKEAMTTLPFATDFNEKTKRMLNAYADTMSHDGKASKPMWGYGRVALVACLLMVTLTTVAFAAVRILTPKEVASHFGNTALAAAFESEGAVVMNEEVVIGEYTVALNGVVHGKDIAEYVENTSSSYVVLSVRYTDGRSIAAGDTLENDPIGRFTVSPYVHGKRPSEVNLFTLESRAVKGVIENVLYLLLETDKLSEFAGVPMYLGVAQSDTMAVFVNDEQSPFTLNADGAIVPKDTAAKELACAVFTLPQ